jgi:pimeloyl-ACP methyl ester carboxylesterase
VNEYLRTFSGKEGVLGAEGVYRAAFTTIAQTAPLQDSKVKVPAVAMGGERGLGARVGQFVSMVASEVSSLVLPGCGHFIPEERPDAVVDQVLRLTVLSGAVK